MLLELALALHRPCNQLQNTQSPQPHPAVAMNRHVQRLQEPQVQEMGCDQALTICTACQRCGCSTSPPKGHRDALQTDTKTTATTQAEQLHLGHREARSRFTIGCKSSR